ncbi:polysaccharide deacetylase family protein [Saccharothrix saharensis]|uniref:polysaccharide deacetylase family protein n=1 Tax=Saccharothrix saharensis TaxID=571190 RepID=UPI00369C09C9
MKPTERIDYDPITGRPPLQLPEGARVAVWLIVNVEQWADTEPMPRTVLTPPAGGTSTPDVPNWAWHEYGNRVGFWRLLNVIDRHAIPAAFAVNGSAITAYPQITDAALSRHWEFLGHGYTQKNMQKVDDEPDDIRRTRDAITTATGRPLRGWLGPGLTETWETPDLLVEHGFDYVCDWVLDDQPTLLRTRTTPIVNIPYTQECNDVAMMLIQHHTAEEYRRRPTDQFDQLLADARADDSARVMALVVHPYIMGAPHRTKYLDQTLSHITGHEEALFCTGEQILDWYTTNHTVATTPAPAHSRTARAPIGPS